MVVVQQTAHQHQMRVDTPGGTVGAGRDPGHGLGSQPKFPKHCGVDDDHVSDVDQRLLDGCDGRVCRRAGLPPLGTILLQAAGRIRGRGVGHGVSVARTVREWISQEVGILIVASIG
jgi:hypothetical protein